MIEGKLVELNIPIDSSDIHETIGIEINNLVEPLSFTLSRMPITLTKKIELLKNGKVPFIVINSIFTSAEGPKEKIKINHPYFHMIGWECNDDYESNSGVNISDTLEQPNKKKGKQKEDYYDKLSRYIGNNVRIEVVYE